jgi:LmbE family N-acetylglucosaminyl deacetylase|tara:strand:+ start:322 stop:1257 length:936 start_codon:yes stop_codon:yes gene_type:complete
MPTPTDPRVPSYTPIGEVTIEKRSNNKDKPHQSKVLAAVQAHADDIPFFCAGLCAKLIDEGYTAYLIQTTNDEKCGPGTMGEAIAQNEREIEVLAREIGFKQVIHLGYRNHFLDEASPIELRARLVFLIRALKIDTITTFNPWGHWEENPDHTITGQAVEAARWMAGMGRDYPEQLACGMQPHSVKDLYYWAMRPEQPYNTVVDISDYLDKKVASMSANKAQGPAGAAGRRLKARLAAEGKRLPALDGEEEEADRQYISLFGLQEYQRIGAPHGLQHAEPFYYMPPGGTFTGSMSGADIESYIAEHAEHLP